MEIFILIILVVLGAGVWLVVRAIVARNEIAQLRQRIDDLEDRLRLERIRTATSSDVSQAAPNPLPPILSPVAAPMPTAIPPATKVAPAPAPAFARGLETFQPPTISSLPKMGEPAAQANTPPAPPVMTAQSPEAAMHPEPESSRPAINWEQFMGVKGFAWVGGFALFLGIAFFVKYSFDKNLVPPQLRVAIGFLAGIGLLVGGIVMSRKNYPALSQTLCATGVVVIYAVTYACHAFYHFALFGPLMTFGVMSVITVAAFFLAVRLNALVVAVLGMLGGFLTPILLSTGQDNPLGLFGYIAILDIGLIVIALNRRWDFLPALAAFGTIFLQMGWAVKFFEREHYFEGNKIFIALTILFVFNAIYLAGNWVAKKRRQSALWLPGAHLVLAAMALAFTMFFFSYPTLADRPVLIFSFVFVIDLMVTALAFIERRTMIAQFGAGLAAFGIMAAWTCDHLTPALLIPALVFYFIFAVFHSALPALLEKRSPGALGNAGWLGQLFPPLALLLVLVPIFKLDHVSFVVWPFVLVVDLLAIALAALTAGLLPVLAALLLTLGAIAELIFKIPTDLNLEGLTMSFVLLGAFSIIFVAASVWLARRLAPGAFTNGLKMSGGLGPEATAAMLPACSAALPFLLLIMATLRLPLTNPSPIFEVALLLVALLLGLTRIFALDWMPLIGLASTFLVECTWHFNQFDGASVHALGAQAFSAAPTALTWYLIFFGVFAVFPFLFLRKFTEKSDPWAAAALAGPAQFFLIHRLVKVAWPNHVMGLLPAAFAVPALLSFLAILKATPPENKARMTQLAWFGGVALFFITLIFPIQFDREWITVGWALEGAALLWLFHRVPHPGLRLTGCCLLVTAFARLAANPAVLDYHPRSATPIFNWYLYTYGIVTVALFVGARLLAPPRHRISDINAQAVLVCLAPTLAFLLLNIEIADYFSAPGSTLTFEFSGNFARDMTYSIAWALFALGLLVYGIRNKTAAARYPAMALLCVTLVKLFFHDLAQLGQLYRIGALIGVAVVAMLASFAYQKFYAIPAKAAGQNEV